MDSRKNLAPDGNGSESVKANSTGTGVEGRTTNPNADETSMGVRRRTVLGAAGSTLSGVVGGCLGIGSGEEFDYDGEEFVDEEDEADYGDWLGNVDYPGTVDWTGEDEVTVLVGTGPNGLSFGPAAIRIDAGTAVVWEWTGVGGRHDVVDTDGTFESEQTQSEGHTFAHTFDEPGVSTYMCEPHRRQGMKGAVDVV